jgi:hypothetical protein
MVILGRLQELAGVARSAVHHPDARTDPMSPKTDHPTFLRRSLQLDGIASGLCAVLRPAAAVRLFAGRELVGLTRSSGATG